MEVYNQAARTWGTVCDDSWDINDASAACKEAGFSGGATAAKTNAYFGARHAARMPHASITPRGVVSVWCAVRRRWNRADLLRQHGLRE